MEIKTSLKDFTWTDVVFNVQFYGCVLYQIVHVFVYILIYLNLYFKLFHI
jgi:hypothetical protein